MLRGQEASVPSFTSIQMQNPFDYIRTSEPASLYTVCGVLAAIAKARVVLFIRLTKLKCIGPHFFSLLIILNLMVDV